MNNLEARYSVIGTSALKAPEQELCPAEHIVDFPSGNTKTSGGKHAKANTRGYLHSAAKKARRIELVNALETGSAAGKPFNKATPLQTGLIGCGMFAFAMACAFFGA